MQILDCIYIHIQCILYTYIYNHIDIYFLIITSAVLLMFFFQSCVMQRSIDVTVFFFFFWKYFLGQLILSKNVFLQLYRSEIRYMYLYSTLRVYFPHFSIVFHGVRKNSKMYSKRENH